MLLIQNDYSHVSHDTVKDFEDTLRGKPEIAVAKEKGWLRKKCERYVFGFYKRLINNQLPPPVINRYLKVPLADKRHLLMIMMGPDELKWKPFASYSCHCKSIYLFDAWPKDYQYIVSLCEKYRVNYLFVTSKQSTERLAGRLPETRVSYVPEAIRFETFCHRGFENKDIDVLALGRKWDAFHNAIFEEMQRKGYVYLYEKVKGEIVFPTRELFVDGLARTKISICVPSSITHPDRAGDIETMTVRYLESMASKCLVLGVAPKEMIELFGYNPVVEIDMKNPSRQIEDILQNYDSYIPLIERNYAEVANNHTWDNRYERMKAIWNREGLKSSV